MRLIYAEDAIRSLMAYERGEKTIGQCIDDTVSQEPSQLSSCASSAVIAISRASDILIALGSHI